MRTEYWIKNQDTSYLNYSEKQNRIQTLKFLRKYWKKEQFPLNTTYAKRIPQIKDAKGTMCALAYILHNSGEQSTVKDLARNNNYVLVNDVPDDHNLMGIIAEKGISKREAAKIQPSYSCEAIIGRMQTGSP